MGVTIVVCKDGPCQQVLTKLACINFTQRPESVHAAVLSLTWQASHLRHGQRTTLLPELLLKTELACYIVGFLPDKLPIGVATMVQWVSRASFFKDVRCSDDAFHLVTFLGCHPQARQRDFDAHLPLASEHCHPALAFPQPSCQAGQ